MKEEFCAGGLIFRNGEFLVLQYDENYWGHIKGHIEKGEDELKAALREIKEETCITELEQIPGFKETTDFVIQQKEIHKTVVFFLFKTNQKEVCISPEHVNYKWVKLEEAEKQITYENDKEIFRKAVEFLKNLE